MAKITLIVPENKTDADPMVYPPLGLLYLAAVLERDNHEIYIHDMREEENNIQNIPLTDYYCFTAVTPQINRTIEISQHIRKEFGKFTIVGGAHASWKADTLTNYFDTVVIGEGESVIQYIINDNIRGIIDSNKTKIQDINKIPFPSRHLLPKKNIVSKSLWSGYRFEKEDGPIATTLITSRGCPWKCAFCANVPQPIRFRSVENIIGELKNIIEDYNCKNFRFLDDNFTLNKLRLVELSKQFQSLNIQYRCSARSDLINEEMCELLVKSGCKEIGFGVESGDDSILKLLNKKETVADHKRAIEIAKSFGLRTKVFLMTGLPGETWESIELTKKFIMETRPDKWIVTLFIPYPGSSISNNLKKYNIEIVDKNLSNYIITHPAKSVIKTNLASREELEKHFDSLLNYLKESYSL